MSHDRDVERMKAAVLASSDQGKCLAMEWLSAMDEHKFDLLCREIQNGMGDEDALKGFTHFLAHIGLTHIMEVRDQRDVELADGG